MTARNRLLTTIIALLLAGSAAAADLAEVYRLAAQNDPVLSEAEDTYRAAQEASPQAWALYLPQLTGAGNQTRSNADGSNSFFDSNTFQFVTRDFTSDTHSHAFELDLRQTVFNWAKIKNIQSAGAQVAQAQADYDAALQSFIVRTAQRYFGQLSAADALEAARQNREAIGHQLEQSKKRFEVGLIAVTDVQESQAAYDQAVADEIAAERAFQSTRELLRASTGQFIDDLKRPGEAMPLVDPQPAASDDWVKMAMQQNLALVSSRFAVDAAQYNLSAAWGGHFPTLDFVASKSRFNSTTDQTIATLPAPSSADQSSGSIALQLSVPLFAGGGTQSRVRQAQHLARAAQDRLDRITRETQSQARDALLGVNSEIARTKALRQAAESAQTALRATEAGFEVGTRTTVDVLQSRTNLLRAQVNYRNAKYQYLLNTLLLKQAVGQLGNADVQQVNGWLTTSTAAEPIGETPTENPAPTKQ